jgi:hypothetical protein
MWIMGPARFALTVGIMSPPNLGGWNDYFDAPWETIADMFGGAPNSHDKNVRKRAIWFTIVATICWPAAYFFLLGKK